MILVVLMTGCSSQEASFGNHEEHRPEEYARSLRADARRAEAISYLTRELDTEPPGIRRFSLLLLLTDLQLDLADLDGAAASMLEARLLASDTSAQEALAKREQRFRALETLVPTKETEPEEASVQTTGPDPAISEEERAAANTMVSNSFFETDLRQVLTDLSMDAGVPIVWDNTVQGLVTYEVLEQPLAEVLDAILLPAGFVSSFQNGTYYVGSPSPENPAFGLLSITDVVSLSNIDATEAIKLLSVFFQPYVKASMTDNTVCISGPPSYVERIRSDLVKIDHPPTQILIEVLVSEISSSAMRSIGVDWSLLGVKGEESWQILSGLRQGEGATLMGAYGQTAMGLGDFSVDLVASLEALIQSGDAEIRANPRIATLNGRTAEIGLTRDQYFIIATSTSQYTQYNTLQSVSSGIKLEITPYASDSGEITVHVKPEVGDVVGSGTDDLPEINRRTAATTVRVMSGETFTIGGLTVQREKSVVRKVPVLGSIPVLGRLFSYTESEQRDTQIVIFITPRILRG